MWRHADGHDAASLDDVEPLLLSGFNQFIALAAWIEPQLITAARGDFGQHFQANRRRQIDADTVELYIGRDVSERLIDRQSFHFAPFWVHRIDGIAASQKRPHGFISELCAVSGCTEDGDRGHGPTPLFRSGFIYNRV